MATIILILVVLVLVAWYYTDDKYGFTSPAMVIGQTLKWLTLGFLAGVDTTKLTAAATANANESARLAAKESRKAVNLGIKAGREEYRTTDARKFLVSTTKEIKDDTKRIRAALNVLND